MDRGSAAVATPPATQTATETRLPITGMTCASCVRRVEKALGKVAGVSGATVNLATEKATVTYDPAIVSADNLRAGRRARRLWRRHGGARSAPRRHDGDTTSRSRA